MPKNYSLVRPGVRMFDQWTPDLFNYPFRFSGPKVGDPVYIIVRHRKTKEFKIVKDKIAEIIDCYNTTLAIKDNNWFINEKTGGYALAKDHGQIKDQSTYLIDYWIKNFNPGHGLTYGNTLFETRESAQEVLNDILDNLEKWDS
jgi:hypothetical protein